MSTPVGLPDKKREPDVFMVEVHHHADKWSNGVAPDIYRFRVIGNSSGATRWTPHLIEADRSQPPTPDIAGLARFLIEALAKDTGREIASLRTSLISWKEEEPC